MYNMARSRIAPTLGTCIPFPAMRTIAFAETGNSTCEMLAALAANSVAGMPWLSSNSMGVIVLLAWVLYKERQFVVCRQGTVLQLSGCAEVGVLR